MKCHPMICRILDATEGIFVQRVVVTRSEEVASLCRERGVQTVLHSLPHRSDTVRLGLEALGELDCCMFLPGDQPLLRRETVVRLIRCWEEHRERIVRPAYGGSPGAPVMFPAWAFPELLNLPEGKGGGALIRKYPDRVRCMEVADPRELMDVDTPEDLKQLARMAEESTSFHKR